MTIAVQSLLVDTNVWLDVYLPDRPHEAVSRALLETAIRSGVSLLYTNGQAKDLFFLVTQYGKQCARLEGREVDANVSACANEFAWGVIKSLSEVATSVGSDESDAWLARKYRAIHQDFGDNLVVAAAARAHADYLVTNDEALLKHTPVATISPADLLSLLQGEGEEEG